MRFIKNLSIVFTTFSIILAESFVGGDSLFPYGTAEGDQLTGLSDDGSSVQLDLPATMQFFSKQDTRKAFHNTNGVISFDTTVRSYNVLDFPSRDFPPMIAAYFTDIDTRPNGDGNKLYARTTTKQSDIDIALPLIKNCDNSQVFCDDASDFEPLYSSVFSYVQVTPWTFNLTSSKSNSFQVGLIYDDYKTWVVLSYENITFYDPESSSNSSLIGFNDVSGIGNTSFLISNITSDSKMQELMTSSNCGRAGVYVYNVSSLPEPPPSLLVRIIAFILSFLQVICFCF